MLLDKTANLPGSKDESGEDLVADPDGGHGLYPCLAESRQVGGNLNGFEFQVRGIGNDLFQDAAYEKATRTEDGAEEFYFHGVR